MRSNGLPPEFHTPLKPCVWQAMEKTGAAEAIAGGLMKLGAQSGGHEILIAIIYIVSPCL